ncbi:hypothetical protein [Streptomyces longhuiensis]|nr:hypothetical protein [Streptomyces longhuiensis]
MPRNRGDALRYREERDGPLSDKELDEGRAKIFGCVGPYKRAGGR